ncbi:MAG TPA: GTP-binding protein, partial [Candidatus Limnocylindrales bacterium]|nr:GTP-binding protein [Candidatus Limnocylindrales bacterium]
MNTHATGDLRNLAFIGGPGTGKTSLVEALLFKAGAIQRLGTVPDGTTTSDWRAEEKEKQHSSELSVLHAVWKGRRFNLFDAPGYPDFVGEAAAALAASETAIMCVDAVRGLSFTGRKAWELAGAAGRARCVVVTHLDGKELDWPAWVSALGEALGARCVPVVAPQGTGKSFTGVERVPLGGAASGPLASLADALVEAVVEIDDAALTRFLEQDQRPSEDQAAALLRRSIVAGSVVPVLAVSSLDGKGIEELLEFIARCLPSPADGPLIKDEAGKPVEPTAPGSSAFVFKTIIDPYVGRLSLARVVTGELVAGTPLLIARTGKPEKLAHLQLSQGKEHVEVPKASAGDIVAIPKVEALETSDSLHDAAHPRRFPPLRFPRPMVARSIEPVNHADDAKLSTALKRTAAEDPTFIYERDEATGQLVARGMSLMHLETVLRRIKDRQHVEVKVELPRVALRETVTRLGEGHHRHKKQTGGRGQFAEVYLTVEAAARGAGLVFEDDTVGGTVPKQFIPAIEKGVREQMQKGVIAGYPVVDVTVRVTDGKFHDVDSDEASFKMAGGRAFRDGFVK